MKKYLFLILFLSLLTFEAKASEYEWTNIGESLPKSKGIINLTALDIIGDSIWICSGLGTSASGLKGEIYFSPDGGKSFSIQNTLYGTHSIKMLDSKNGYCAGYEGQVYNTTDGGQEWKRIGSTGVTNTSIDFPKGSDTGYVGGFKGVFRKITPNGLIPINSATSNDIRAISCSSRDHIYVLWWADIVFYDGKNEAFLQEISVDSKLPLSFLSIFMYNDTLGWIAGAYGLIAKTTTGGLVINDQSPYIGQITNVNTDLYSIKFYNDKIGVACGYGGKILITSNGGENWELSGQGLTTEMLLATEFANNGDIYIVGNSKENEIPILLKGKLKTTSINEDKKYSDFIFPNPASDYIEIDVGTGRDLSLPGNTINVFNALGECIISETGLRPVSTKIDISGLPPGVYFVRSGGYCAKFVKGE